jgi:hypothetical protein
MRGNIYLLGREHRSWGLAIFFRMREDRKQEARGSEMGKIGTMGMFQSTIHNLKI